MSTLILIKHAPPRVDPTIPTDQWPPSDKGRALCRPLANQLSPHGPTIVISSTEPKAIETAAELSRHLNIPTDTAPNLHEHNRSNVPHMQSRDFISMMELFFRKPNDLVLGRETAQAASDRLHTAINTIVQTHPNQTSAIVTHGTVLALFLARHNPDRNPFLLWRQLGLPSFAVLTIPDFRIQTMADKIA